MGDDPLRFDLPADAEIYKNTLCAKILRQAQKLCLDGGIAFVYIALRKGLKLAVLFCAKQVLITVRL